MNPRILLALLTSTPTLACSLQSFDDVTGGQRPLGIADAAGGGSGGSAGSTSSGGYAGAPIQDAGNETGSGAGGVTVSGSLEFVGGNPAPTNVILAPADSFDPAVVHFTVPEGPKATGVTGAWSIDHVPPGNYFVLVAFENDGKTRDPKSGVTPVTVGEQSFQVGSIPVTPAITILEPNGDTLPPSLIAFDWIDDDSESSYDLSLVDSAGNQIWSAGYFAGTTHVDYSGSVLPPGQYQIRIRSVGSDLLAIHRSEDLAGTFTVP